MTDAPTLKPCPFCGGEARIDPPYRHAAICRKCSARGPVPNYSGGEAAHTWNRRALPADDAEMEERVGRRLCAEKCAFYGDPPCWRMAEDEGLDWTGGAATAARCDEDCIALARAALSAMRGEP